MSETDLLKERIENQLEIFRLQQGRLASDWDSEKDNRKLLSDRVSDLSKAIHDLHHYKNRTNEQIEKFERILLNEGKGLVWKVGNISMTLESNKDSGRYRLNTVLSIAAILLSLITSLIAIFK